jgi:hypothetical protein
MGEKMGEKMGKKMREKMREKMGGERCKGERETAIYRIRSPRQNAQGDENNVLKYEADNVSACGHFAGRQEDGDNCLGMSSGWQRL